jgi:hypothetical protein
VVLAGLITQLVATAHLSHGYFDTSAKRVLNVFCFFTILSNILFGATSALMALRPDRGGPVFTALRLSGVLAMTVTGIVYHVALRGLHELHGIAKAADVMLHSVTPILALVGWLAFGPRGKISGRIVLLSAAYPVIWLVFTLIRGAAIGFYPYPFLDAHLHGYGRVAANCVLVAALFLGMAAAAAWLGERLPGVASERDSAPGDR